MKPTETADLPERLRLACGELSGRLRAGEPCRAEDFLPPDGLTRDHHELVLELLYTEYVVRHELGQKPDPNEWFARFPDWHADLQELFQIHEYVCGEEEIRTSTDETVTGRVRDDTYHELGEAGSIRTQPLDGYELMEEIGRGGMGAVYRAKQISVNRIVAVKMILTGQSTSTQDYRRFATEAQVAASLHHPHIVQVFEAGEERGQQFLVMEFVAGSSLEAVLAKSPLTARAAAELLVSLAEAMHYAHQRGVIHRDLKPSNILLADDGQPKISDFGLAKFSGAADPSRVTLSGVMLGTPCYMPPEQAAGELSKLGPHSDIYGLGAILYQSITGRPPYVADSLAEILLQIRQSDPVGPCRLNPYLPRDLETICLKCLEKLPSNRYRSAEELAQDLGRFLRGEPIVARSATVWERGCKWARRRPLVATLLATVALVTGVGVAGMRWQTRRAVLEAEMSRATTRFFDDVLTSIDPALTRGKAITVREMLDEAATRMRASTDLHPRLKAGLHDTLGVTYARLGESELAEQHLSAALKLYRTTKGLHNELTLKAASNLALTLKDLDRLEEAESQARHGLEIARRELGEDHRVTRLLLTNLAVTVDAAGRTAEAEQLYRDEVAFQTGLHGIRHRHTLQALSNLGAWLLNHAELDKAEPIIRQCWEVQCELLGDDHPETLISMSNLTAVLGDLRRWNEALSTGEAMLRLSEQVRGADDTVTLSRELTLAKILSQSDRPEEAIAHAQHALDNLRTRLGSSHSLTLAATETLVTLVGLGGNMEHAEEIALNSYKEVSTALGEQHSNSRRAALLLANLYDSWERREDQRRWEQRARRTSAHED